MPVYIDDFFANYGRMKMCHMLADTDEELHSMADRIGIQRKWWQSPHKTSGSHYDIAISKRKLALEFGAIAISYRQAAAMNRRRAVEGVLGDPNEAILWLNVYMAVIMKKT